jgi:hypothetical protein
VIDSVSHVLNDTVADQVSWGGVIGHEDVFAAADEWCPFKVRVKSVMMH